MELRKNGKMIKYVEYMASWLKREVGPPLLGLFSLFRKQQGFKF